MTLVFSDDSYHCYFRCCVVTNAVANHLQPHLLLLQPVKIPLSQMTGGECLAGPHLQVTTVL